MSTSIIRHQWLESALSEFRTHFTQCGYTIPDNVRISIGLCRTHAGRKALGQCFDKTNSKDNHYELFVSPEVGKNGEELVDQASTMNILETIAHELCHATVGNEHGHQGAFITIAQKVGFARPWRYTPSGDGMKLIINAIIAKQGLFPAGALMVRAKKQGKSLVKCNCECGFVAYITTKNLMEHGTPICPTDFIAMECE